MTLHRPQAWPMPYEKSRRRREWVVLVVIRFVVRHVFHSECIDKWFRTSERRPICPIDKAGMCLLLWWICAGPRGNEQIMINFYQLCTLWPGRSASGLRQGNNRFLPQNFAAVNGSTTDPRSWKISSVVFSADHVGVHQLCDFFF